MLEEVEEWDSEDIDFFPIAEMRKEISQIQDNDMSDSELNSPEKPRKTTAGKKRLHESPSLSPRRGQKARKDSDDDSGQSFVPFEDE